MKSSMNALNLFFSVLESVTTLLLAPLTLITMGGLILVTALINRQVRNEQRRRAVGPQVWARTISLGA